MYLPTSVCFYVCIFMHIYTGHICATSYIYVMCMYLICEWVFVSFRVCIHAYAYVCIHNHNSPIPNSFT